MAIRSRNVALGNSVTVNTTTIVYTVPAGRTLILRQYSLVNMSGIAREVAWSIRRGVAFHRVASTGSLANGARLASDDAYIVLNAGDQIGVYTDNANTSGAIHYSFSGSLLEGLPL